MRTIPLYRYTRPDGGVTVSTVKPDTDYTELTRLVADEGYVLTDGNATTHCTDTDNPEAWTEVQPGLWYNPHRISEEKTAGEVLELCRKWCRPLPVAFSESDGYMVTVFENEGGVTVHLLAEKYDTDIDHHLDEIRFHRSRVNYVNKADPMGVTRTLRGTAATKPTVYLPLTDETAEVTFEKGTFTVNLPEKCAYIILRFCK